jgi:hypothetical protein
VYGIIEVLGATRWEIAAARAVVGHEDRVTDKNRPPDDIAGTGRRVAWGVKSVDS